MNFENDDDDDDDDDDNNNDDNDDDDDDIDEIINGMVKLRGRKWMIRVE